MSRANRSVMAVVPLVVWLLAPASKYAAAAQEPAPTIAARGDRALLSVGRRLTLLEASAAGPRAIDSVVARSTLVGAAWESDELVVIAGARWLETLRVSDRGLEQLGRLEILTCEGKYACANIYSTLAAAQGFAYVGGYEWNDVYGAMVRVIDLRSPAEPRVRGAAEVSWSSRWPEPPWSLVAHRAALYVGDTRPTYRQVEIVDAGDPDAPAVLSVLGTFMAEVVAGDETVYAAVNGGIGVWDASDPLRPTQVEDLDLLAGKFVSQLASGGGHLYAVIAGQPHIQQPTALVVFDLADPLSPRQAGHLVLNTGGTAPDIGADERWLWVAEESCVRLFDVEAHTPMEVGCFDLEASTVVLPRLGSG